MIDKLIKKKTQQRNSLIGEVLTTYYFLESESLDATGVMVTERIISNSTGEEKTSYSIKPFGVQSGLYFTDYGSGSRTFVEKLYEWFDKLSKEELIKILKTV